MEKDNKYSRGKIYKIVSQSNPELVYYGSTINELYKRFHHHKSHTGTTSKLIMCYDDAKIILVESYPCNNRNELEAKEFEYIMSNDCVNKVGKGLDKENQKIYQKQYHIDNKEAYKEYQRKYKEANNKTHMCECGGKYQTQHKSSHLKTKKHIKFEKDT